jgi:hypothetical protein
MKTLGIGHVFLAVVTCFAMGCSSASVEGTGAPEPPPSGGSSGSSGGGADQTSGGRDGAITWCSTSSTRTGTVGGTSLDYPSTPSTTWFNTSLEELALSPLDEAMMKEAGLSPDDVNDVNRFKYFTRGFDFRLILGDPPSPGNWFGKTDLSVYLFDVAETATAPDTEIAVFDASAVREARLSGDKQRLAATLRTTVDAMKATHTPKAIVAFAPDRNPETSEERAFINLFARNVYFATIGRVTLSNLRGASGAALGRVTYPLRGLRTVDLKAVGAFGDAAWTATASCLDVRTSG